LLADKAGGCGELAGSLRMIAGIRTYWMPVVAGAAQRSIHWTVRFPPEYGAPQTKALDALAAMNLKLPEGYKFDREQTRRR